MVRGLIGIEDPALKKQEKLVQEQKAQAQAEQKRLTAEQSSKVKAITGTGYGQRSLLSPTRQTLG